MPRLTVSAAVAALLALPAVAQETPTPVPVIPAPQTQATPQTGDAQGETRPQPIAPARKATCSDRKQVTS